MSPLPAEPKPGAVWLLQFQLSALGFDIPADELHENRFGDKTRQAVELFRDQAHLSGEIFDLRTGELDRNFATALGAKVKERPNGAVFERLCNSARDLLDRIDALAGDIARLQGEKGDLSEKLRERTQALQDLEGVRQQLDGELQKLRDENALLGPAAEEATKRAKKLEEELNSTLAQIGNLKGEIANLAKTNGTLTEDLQKAKDELLGLRDLPRQLEELLREKGRLLEDAEKAAGLQKDLEEKLRLAQARIGELETGGPLQRAFVVSGQVRCEEGLPLQGVRVRAVHEVERRSIRLGEDTTDAEGRYTIRYELLVGVDAINLRMTVYDADGRSLHKSDIIQSARPLETVDLTVPGGEIKPYRVQGRVVSRTSAGVGGLRVVIVDKRIDGDITLAEAPTDEGGAYRVALSGHDVQRRGKKRPDLQARVFAGDAFLGASDVHYNASEAETLDVVLADKATSALRSEHEILTSALASHFTGKLGDLQETDDRQDITYLANKTGWDARAVALAALADRFSAQTADAAGAAAIPPAFFYALFRAGLPANEDTLYHVDAGMVEAVWGKAAEQGVIPKVASDQIAGLVGRFQSLSAGQLLTGRALIGESTLGQMLAVSGIDDHVQQKFAQLYVANHADMQRFWTAIAEDPAFGATPEKRSEMVARLQVDGKLAFLTINNAPLMQKVHAQKIGGANRLSDPLRLAQAGYHRAASWSHLLTADVPIPKEIPGDTPESRRNNYADYLAAQVRLSYPTAAVAEMLRNSDPNLRLQLAGKDFSDEAFNFLCDHQSDFVIGVEPVQHYIYRKKLNLSATALQEISRLHRVLQITPSDQAMAGLLRRGIDAAYQIVRHDRSAFVQSFAADLGGADQAALTYDRSVQVHSAVLNVVLSYVTARTAPVIGRHSPTGILDPTPANAGDVIAYATLESLFDSLDFCACDHCRSILSPAAYLVDLLLFLQSEPDVWNESLETWKRNHAGTPYPFADENAWQKFQSDWNSQHAGQPLPNTEISPFDVLMSRRPDIQHLPLTCENTNTALPYIDVVNETLEYFIANDSRKLSLDDYLGHDIDDAATEDLLASPQFVVDSAYDTLHDERFPAPLPFHRPLENLRRLFDKFEVPLPLAMERLRQTDALERETNLYGWRDILMEEIDLSRDEYEILTDSTAVPLWRMYGFPDGTVDADVIAGLSSAKQFARRLGITYDDLISVLTTRFINPHGDLVPKLERLGVSFATLKALKEGTISAAAFDALLPTGAQAPDPERYAGDIRSWVKRQENYERMMGLVTLVIPADPWAASTVYAEGACVRPMAAQWETTLYCECTTPGKSAATEPQWPTTPGKTVSDGDAVWTCRDTSSSSSFDNLALRYSDPAKLTQDIGAAEFVRLLRFIRLWKKLGWAIEQTDAAICALYRKDLAPLTASDIDDIAKLDIGFLTLLPRLGIVSRIIKALNLKVARDLLPLLACFSEIGTYGDTALYRQMFLNPALLEQDAAFADNGYGEFPKSKTEKLAAHAESLRSAFNLTGDEFFLIVEALNFVPRVTTVQYTHPQPVLEQAILDAAPDRISYSHLGKQLSYRGFLAADSRDALKAVPGVAAEFQQAVDALYAANQDALFPLTLENISAVFRRGWLARKLKLSVRELLLLTQLTGLDPFAAPDPTNPRILRLIDLVQALRDRSYKSAAALYLIWNQDLSGKSTPDPAQIGALARTLRGDFASIDEQFAAIEDPNGDLARARMTLVYGQETSDAFFALLDDELVVDVTYTQEKKILEDNIIAAAPKIAYDHFRHRLSHVGLLTNELRQVLKGVPGVRADLQQAIGALYDRSNQIMGLFFNRYPELKAPYRSAINELPAKRHSAFLAVFQPALSRRRKRQQAVQRLSAAAGVDPAFTQALLDPVGAPYPLHADGDTNRAGLDDVLALETPGLAVRFFFRDNATGDADESIPAAANLAYTRGGSNPLPNPGSAISGIWSGQVEIPETGFYNFVIEADRKAEVTLQLDGQDRPLTQNGNVWRNTEALELKAGVLCEVELRVSNVRDALSLKWETPSRAREVIPSRYLYPPSIAAPFSGVYVRFLKAASLAAGLGLTASEMAFFATASDCVINGDGWLNALSVTGTSEPATSAALLTPFGTLLNFVRVKADISPNDESLLTVLKDPAAATQNADSLLFAITHWSQASLSDILARFSGTIAELGHFGQFRRVCDAFALIQKMGIPAQALIQATTNDPTADTLRGLQAALRARHDAASWRDVVRPINDEMRGLQRDALVAYILHQMRSHPDSAHIDTPEKLFEYFLMDVQMDPCMLTSRIRHALSSVQLFIERCLMNLEPRVSPAAINAKRWGWMKRYRVWEANRKVYLFPENWLEPELRDDKSPFFKETESELLQGDITEERAATALLNYLSKLEDVAKLEPCGIYHIPASSVDGTGEINHVIARTTGANRKYYYRRYEYGYWTPWEQVKTDIDDNPVLPVVWKDRLLLFWLRILKKEPETIRLPFASAKPEEGDLSSSEEDELSSLKRSDISTDPPQVVIQAMLCWSEYYNGKWQPTKTSNVDKPLDIGTFDATGSGSFARAELLLRSSEEDTGALLIHIGYAGDPWKHFVIYNTHSLPVLMTWPSRQGSKELRRRIETEVNRVLGESNKIAVDHWANILDQILSPILIEIRAGIGVYTLREIEVEIKDRIKEVSSDIADKIRGELGNILLRLLSSQLLKYRRITLVDNAEEGDALQLEHYDPSIMVSPVCRSILQSTVNAQTIEPQHAQQDPWDAPFLYEDSRHVFYVTATEKLVRIPDRQRFGILAHLGHGKTEIPPLVLKEIQRDLKPRYDKALAVINPGTAASAPIQRFVTEDAYIRHGIGMTGVVSFGDKQIGLTGAIRSVRGLK